MRALGIDFGTKIIGFAITDNDKKICCPLEQFTYTKNDLIACINKIKMIYDNFSKNIDVIIIGYPIYPSGDKSPMCLLIDKLKILIEKNISNIKVILHDERYTTVQTIDLMKESGLKASKIKKIKDKISANIILSDWLKNGKI